LVRVFQGVKRNLFITQYQWILGLVTSDAQLEELEQYAILFTRHHINGKRLLTLQQDDLRDMGVTSVGHRNDFLVSDRQC